MTQLTMFKARTYTVTETVQPVDANGNQVLGAGGVTGFKFWMTAKLDVEVPDNQAVFQKLPASWAVTTAGDATHAAVVVCVINPADTASLPEHQLDLVWDIQMEDNASNFYTIDGGILTVKPNVTQATV
jgi:hypothetical protein